LLEGS
jgi:hypothetical protein